MAAIVPRYRVVEVMPRRVAGRPSSHMGLCWCLSQEIWLLSLRLPRSTFVEEGRLHYWVVAPRDSLLKEDRLLFEIFDVSIHNFVELADVIDCDFELAQRILQVLYALLITAWF